MRRLIIRVLVGFAIAAAGVPAASAKLRSYVVKRGDTCWNIAARFFGDPKHYDIIHKYNQLGPLPHILTIGSVLRLPLSTNTADAQIEWLRREVKAKSPTNVDWFNARPRMNLWRLYKVSTGSGSTAGIRFEDDALLKMRAGTLVVIYGGVGGKTKSERLQKRSIVLEKGTLRGGLNEFYKQAGLKVTTPSSEVIIKSKETQVEVDKQQRSIVSVFDGEALVKAKNKLIKVLKDYGTIVEKNKAPEKPRPLPRAPKWAAKVREVVLLAPTPHSADFVASWLPVGKAARYRVELASNKRFREPIVDAVVGRGITRLKVEKLPPGTYFARVATVGQRRLHSRPSKLLRVRVLAVKTSRLFRRTAANRYEVSGMVRIFPPSGATVIAALDDQAPAPFRAPLRLYEPKDYRIAVRDAKGAEVTSISVRVHAVRATVRLAAPSVTEGQLATLIVELKDDANRPALLPELRLVRYPGGPLALTTAGPGKLKAQFVAPPRSRTASVVLRLSWAGGDLVDQTLGIIAKPTTVRLVTPRPVAIEHWIASPALVGWGQRAFVYHLRGVRVRSNVGVGTNVVSYRTSSQGDKPMIGTTVQAELGFLDNRLGVDAQFSWLNFLPGRETLGRNKVGDLHLGLRYLAFRRPTIAFGPQLALQIPFSDFERPRRDYLLEPGFVLDWTPHPTVTLTADVRLFIGFNDAKEVPLLLGAALAVAYQPWRHFALGADVRSEIGFVGPSDLRRRRALLVNGFLRFPFGRYRLGVVSGTGIGSDAIDAFGYFTVGLTFDIALGGW
ncbi:MAG: LysM peptidoglycan-binding domain-containing protein [Myxococcales bacterium]|nr:LysM peptidoglycan-binding domain-containing protein [Myxococcales bacterium]